MRLEHDPDADALYIYLRENPYAYGRELDDLRNVDYAMDNKPVGIELLNVSGGVLLDNLPEREAVEQLVLAHGIEIRTQPASSGKL